MDRVIKVLVFVFTTALQWRIFQKSGAEGWKSVVPVYKQITFGEIVGKKHWGTVWGLLSLTCDLFVADMIAECTAALYQRFISGNFSGDLTGILIPLTVCVVLYAAMTVVRYVIYREYQQRYHFGTLFTLVWAVVPILGYMRIAASSQNGQADADTQTHANVTGS